LATREEALNVADIINNFDSRLKCGVEEDNWDGNYYVYVIADPGFRPDLQRVVPVGWLVGAWHNPDFRAELTAIYKKI